MSSFPIFLVNFVAVVGGGGGSVGSTCTFVLLSANAFANCFSNVKFKMKMYPISTNFACLCFLCAVIFWHVFYLWKTFGIFGGSIC